MNKLKERVVRNHVTSGVRKERKTGLVNVVPVVSSPRKDEEVQSLVSPGFPSILGVEILERFPSFEYGS